MIKNKVFGVVFFVLLALIYYFYNGENIEKMKEGGKFVKLDISEEGNKTSANMENHNHEIVQVKCSMDESKKLIPDTNLKSISEINLSVDDLLAKNNSNISVIEEGAQRGEVISSIALFRVIGACYSIKTNQKIKSSMEDCADVKTDLVADRFGILERAANSGSLEAKLIYAMNASAMSRYYSELATNETVAYGDAILKKSEIFGRQAAEGGVKEAYLFMSRAYANGSFGVRNPKLAYAFALPLGGGESGANSQYINSLGSRLTTLEREDAEKIAFGCKGEKEFIKFQNPFKMN